MRPNFKNLHVLVTSPEPKGSLLCQLIEKYEGRAIFFPTIAFAFPPDQEKYHQAINQLGNQDWLIFLSPRAVYESIVAIRKVWPHFPPQVKFAAIGAGTAKALKEAGYTIAIHPTQWDSEGLLDLDVFQHISGKNIAIIRGVGGRLLIDKVLAERGANVLTVVAYERLLPDIENENIEGLLSQKAINRVICTSFSGVDHLQQLIDQQYWPYLHSIPLIVVSERIKILAQDLGFQTIWVASNASNDAILDVLASKGTEYDQ